MISSKRNRNMKGKRQRLINYFIIILIIYISYVSSTTTTTDWSHKCPKSCTCIWIRGKKTIECHGKNLNKIPTGLSDEITVLDISDDTIKKLEENIFKETGLVNLHKIKLIKCNIINVHKNAFQDLNILIELDLRDNEIESIHMDSFESNKRLREIYLDNNPLSHLIGEAFSPLSNLHKISLANCKLKKLSESTFKYVNSLTSLDLSGNEFELLSKSIFEPLTHLKQLSLQENSWICDCKLKSFRDWAESRKLVQFGVKCKDPPGLKDVDWLKLSATNLDCLLEVIRITANGNDVDSGSPLILDGAGKEMKLICYGGGNPPPNISWIHNSTKIINQELDKYSIQHGGGEWERWANLTVKNLNTLDEGDYTCKAENKGGPPALRNISLSFRNVPFIAVVKPDIIDIVGSNNSSQLKGLLQWILIPISILFLIIIVVLVVCLRRRNQYKKDTQENSKDMKQEESLIGPEESGIENGVSHVVKEGSLKSSSSKLYKYGGETVVDESGNNGDYPDLLNMSIHTQESFDSLPQQLNPASLMSPPFLHAPPTPSYVQDSFYAPFRPQLSLRPGYVTLPRRPRLTSWSPSTMSQPTPTRNPYESLSVSPTGSTLQIGAGYVKYDNLGPRTTADGSSKLSLNTIESLSQGAPYHNNSPYVILSNFDPIEEVGGDTLNENPHHQMPTRTLPKSWRTPPHFEHEKTPLFSDSPPTPGTIKVPPKPPPKPTKKLANVQGESSSPINHDPDGTEV